MEKRNNIVVFGGSFNPLTKGHAYIIKKCIKLTNAKYGILLPASNSFMNSWKSFDDTNILNTNLRLGILNSFAKRNKNIVVETIEIDGKTSKTYDSLKYLENKYNSKIYFIFGSEKYDELDRWYKIDDLFNEFNLILVSRSFESLDSIINKTPILNKYKDKITLLNIDKKYLDVSSTKIREALKNNDYDSVNKLTYKYITRMLIREAKK